MLFCKTWRSKEKPVIRKFTTRGETCLLERFHIVLRTSLTTLQDKTEVPDNEVNGK